MNYRTAVNIPTFTTSFQFIARYMEYSLRHTEHNETRTALVGFMPRLPLEQVAVEFFQGFVTHSPSSRITSLSLLFDQSSALGTSGSFSYSSAQIYQQTQSPLSSQTS